MTVGDFVEKYGDKYNIEFFNEKNNHKYTIDNDTFDFEQKGWGNNSFFTLPVIFREEGEGRLIFTNIQDPRLRIAVYVIPAKDRSDKSIKNSIVYNLLPLNSDFDGNELSTSKYCFYPKGVSCVQPIPREGLGSDNKEKILNFASDTVGLTELSTVKDMDIDAFMNKDIAVNSKIYYCCVGSDKFYRFISQLNEENLYGYKPILVSILLLWI